MKKRSVLLISMVLILIAFSGTISGCKSVASNATLPVNTVKPAATAEILIDYNGVGQVRNNKIHITAKAAINTFWNDLVLNEYPDSGKSEEDYMKWFLDEAKAKGIDPDKFQAAFNESSKSMRDADKIVFPIVLETCVIENTDCYIISCTWEYKNAAKYITTVRFLDHIAIMVVNSETKETVAFQTCK